MTKQVIEIDVPEGWECIGYRCATKGEYRLDEKATPFLCRNDGTSGRYPIVRKTWQWPVWLKWRSIAMDHNGSWWAHQSKPRIMGDEWISDDDIYCLCDLGFLDFTPPPCDDWKTSLRENPNWKETV